MERDPFKGIKGNNLLEPELLKVSCNLESTVFGNCRIKMVVKCCKIGCSSKNPANAHLSLAALLLKQLEIQMDARKLREHVLPVWILIRSFLQRSSVFGCGPFRQQVRAKHLKDEENQVKDHKV